MSLPLLFLFCGVMLTFGGETTEPPSKVSVGATTGSPDIHNLSTEEYSDDDTSFVNQAPSFLNQTLSVTENVGSGVNDSSALKSNNSLVTSSSNPSSDSPLSVGQSNTTVVPQPDTETTKTSAQTSPLLVYDRKWMDYFISAHHFSGQYSYKEKTYMFDFIVQYKHPVNPDVLVAMFNDEEDGAILEMNGTSVNGVDIVFTLCRMYSPGDLRFPMFTQFEMKGRIVNYNEGSYYSGNITKPVNSSFGWIQMTKGLSAIETGEMAGTRTAIIIIIPTCVACIGVCATVAVICWASKKGFLRGHHKHYRIFSNSQVAYESEAETVHI